MKSDYRSFIEQANVDLERAEKLYSDGNDYGFAIFSAQQGLEKYLKAYLLKIELFHDPKDLGHLAFHSILKRIIEFIQEMKNLDTKYPVFNFFIDAIIIYFENQRKIIEEIRNSKKLQKLLWKVSLGMQTHDMEEIKIAKQLLSSLDKGKIECHTALLNVFKFMMITNPAPTIKLDEKTENEVLEMTAKIFLPILENKPATYDVSELYGKLISIMKPYWITSQMMDEKTFEIFIRFNDLIFTVNCITEMVFAYCHEQISRYPIMIDGINSRTLYKENKDRVLNLIQQIKEKCGKIQSKLDLEKENL
ncbi:MAG: HEPN domain-containing protein [Nitrosopumilaceae archaeon]